MGILGAHFRGHFGVLWGALGITSVNARTHARTHRRTEIVFNGLLFEADFLNKFSAESQQIFGGPRTMVDLA